MYNIIYKYFILYYKSYLNPNRTINFNVKQSNPNPQPARPPLVILKYTPNI